MGQCILGHSRVGGSARSDAVRTAAAPETVRCEAPSVGLGLLAGVSCQGEIYFNQRVRDTQQQRSGIFARMSHRSRQVRQRRRGGRGRRITLFCLVVLVTVFGCAVRLSRQMRRSAILNCLLACSTNRVRAPDEVPMLVVSRRVWVHLGEGCLSAAAGESHFVFPGRD